MPELSELRLMKRVAHLYYERDLTQEEIARRLGLSRPKVSRLLKQAREQGIVKINIGDALESCHDLAESLKRYFGLRDAVVVPTASYIPDMVRQIVGKSAATYVQGILDSRMTVGITWGITLYETVKAMAPKKVPQLRVVQLMGGLGQTSPVLQSFDLARRVAELHDGTCHLLHAPVIAASPEAQAAFVSDRSIRQILEIGRQADLALVGMDALWRHTSLVQVDALGGQELTELERARAAGECCFRFYDIQGLLCHPQLDRRTIGLSLEDLHRIPNVVGVATGLDTVEAILGALRGGFLNVLVSDETVVEKIILLEEERLQAGRQQPGGRAV